MTRRTYRTVTRLWLLSLLGTLLGFVPWWIPAAPLALIAAWGVVCVTFGNPQAPQWRENS